MEFKVTERHYTMQVSFDEVEARALIDQITRLYPTIIELARNKKCTVNDYADLLAFKDKLTLAIAE